MADHPPPWTVFDPLITVAHYGAMAPDDQKRWDVGLLEYWDGNEERRVARDKAKDVAEYKEEMSLGGGLP